MEMVTLPPQKNNPKKKKKKKNPLYNLHQIFIFKKPRCKKIHQCKKIKLIFLKKSTGKNPLWKQTK